MFSSIFKPKPSMRKDVISHFQEFDIFDLSFILKHIICTVLRYYYQPCNSYKICKIISIKLYFTGWFSLGWQMAWNNYVSTSIFFDNYETVTSYKLVLIFVSNETLWVFKANTQTRTQSLFGAGKVLWGRQRERSFLPWIRPSHNPLRAPDLPPKILSVSSLPPPKNDCVRVWQILTFALNTVSLSQA